MLQPGTVYTAAGILRGALLLELEGRRFLLVHTKSPEVSAAVRVFLPRLLTFMRAEVLPWGPPPALHPGRVSQVLDTQALGLVPFLGAPRGAYALWWNPGGEVFAYTRAREVWEGWFALVAGREEAAFLELAQRLFPDLDPQAPLPERLLLSLSTENGTPVLLSYVPDRPPRLHFLRTAPPDEVLGLVVNLTRILRRKLLTFPRGPDRTSSWWRKVVQAGEQEFFEAVGRVVF